MTVLYNAKTKKKDPPDLISQVILYRNGTEAYLNEPEPIDLGEINDFNRIPIRKKMQLGEAMPPGDYVLQFVVKDNNAKDKESLTSQTLDFKITAQ